MKSLSTEVKVGIFVTASLLGIGIIAKTIEPLKYSSQKVEAVYYIIFDNVAGLAKEAPVMVAGVTVGKVDDIQVLPDGKAKVKVILTKKVPIKKDSYAVIETMGLMGEKYIEIIPGSVSLPSLPPGSTITKSKSTISTDQLLMKIYQTVDDLHKSLVTPEGENRIARLLDEITRLTDQVALMVGDNRENLKELVQNLKALSEFLKSDIPEISENMKSLTAQLNQVVVENRDDIREAVRNLKTVSKEIPEIVNRVGNQTTDVLNETKDVVKQAKEIAREIDKTVAKINSMLNDKNRENVAVTLKNIKESTERLNSLLDKIQKGNGTIAKIINDDTLYKNLTTAADALGNLADKYEKTDVYVGFRGDVNTATGNFRGGISFKIVPSSKDRYYLFEVVSDSHGRIDRTTYYIYNGTASTVNEEIRQSFDTEFTLQYARIFKDPIFLKNGRWVLRGGIIETTGGGGIDYFFPGNRWKFFSSAWEFDRKDEYGNVLNPHLRVGLSYNINKNWYIYFGGDELLYDKWRGFFVGSGLVFGDDDVKYLMGSMPSLK
ncbi:MlaD family protein [Desulfurobacterium atlanticum]|uniref:Phospholipid/cholesterol/gamma-HCH transport system substrate-binding protein n=1 Tax=Desulfurobacterium atlanticum TaxID=240169 RepID=A0A238Z8M9_9BACT|nr:MlaD family protein [Desulfurobacterium atlanticum]SNR79321.1 phospholipid/cholesterol/gamma-HCH transport system substrate-binding protein [Desulfurobacterium atlanticum]